MVLGCWDYQTCFNKEAAEVSESFLCVYIHHARQHVHKTNMMPQMVPYPYIISTVSCILWRQVRQLLHFSHCNSELYDPKKLSSIQITTRFIQEMQLKTVMSSSSSLDSQASLLKNQAKSPLFVCLSFNQHTLLLLSCAVIQGQPQRHTQGDIPW